MSDSAYRAACERADAARGQFLNSANRAKERLSPAALKQDAKDKVSGAARNVTTNLTAKARQRPVATGAAAGAFLLYLCRRPLAALFRRLYVRLHDSHTQESETEDG
jgi:hypothetical protein